MIIDRLKGKKIIILDIEELTFIPYIFPIVESLKKKSSGISYYIATHYKGHDEFRKFKIPANRQFGVNLSRNISEADIFLSPHIYGVGNKNSIRIHINHNQPVKYESYQKNDFQNFDIHFLTSPLHRQQTENTIKMYKLEAQNIKLYETGYAKSDDLLSGKFCRNEILKELNLDPLLKTVLYAPSWDEGLSLRAFGEKVIGEILKIKNINLIVKLHPISYCPEDGPNYEFYTGGINWIEKLKRFESNENFRHVPSNNIDSLLEASDVMVTDLSSVALEFIILDKPVIYIDCPEFFEKTLKKTYSNFGNTTAEFVKNDPKANAGRHVGLVVNETGQLKQAIVRSLENPEEFSDKRKEFSKMLIYNPGKAADTAASAIMEILKI
ncbi:MAG: CDP-glycerol glycerophosphotransferase family protein [Ignavibacteria bacterium]|nr:CDP-glycerol glycerophosphotransferase family protein [Ignavibacteria bacterium]